MFKTLVLSCIVALATAATIPSVLEPIKTRVADKEYLIKQKAVLQLLLHVHQPVVVPELKEIIKTFSLEGVIANFNNVESVNDFLTLYKSGEMVGRREVFSPLYKTHLKQAKTVFDVLYGARDWITFYHTAAWMRAHVNYGLFVYAFSTAVIHRPDAEGLVLPPFYEICPHYFVNAETVQRAYEARMQAASMSEGKLVVAIPTNYTGWYKSSNPELRTSYFTEDVGLNAYHYLYHLTYPNWLGDEYFTTKNERKGELFWYVHQQILARYKLERFSNNMYKMANFTYDEPNIVSYDPNLRYINGKEAPGRPGGLELKDCDFAEIERVKDFERRIRDAIDTGFVVSPSGEKVKLDTDTGIETLGRIIEKEVSSINPEYYGSIYQFLLSLVGHVVDPYHEDNVAPSVLENFETMLRDPMYYRIFRRVAYLFTAYKKTLPSYTKNDLLFQNVSIKSVSVDKLMTYFENFDYDITNAVSVATAEEDKVLKVVVRQPRLNHKDFTYRIVVDTPDQVVAGMVRVFLAPKYNYKGRELSLNEKKHYVILIDRFPYEFKRGENLVVRSSSDSTVTFKDMTSFRVLSKQVDDALNDKATFMIYEKGHDYGYPSRLILPKGKKSGMPYTMHVVITPYKMEIQNPLPVRGVKTYVTCGGLETCSDKYPMGFPFDREITNDGDFKLPNIYEIDTVIYHKTVDDTTGQDV